MPQLKKLFFLHISIVPLISILSKSSIKKPHNEFGDFFFKVTQLSKSKLDSMFKYFSFFFNKV